MKCREEFRQGHDSFLSPSLTTGAFGLLAAFALSFLFACHVITSSRLDFKMSRSDSGETPLRLTGNAGERREKPALPVEKEQTDSVVGIHVGDVSVCLARLGERENPI